MLAHAIVHQIDGIERKLLCRAKKELKARKGIKLVKTDHPANGTTEQLNPN
jgi:hypothetical protein